METNRGMNTPPVCLRSQDRAVCDSGAIEVPRASGAGNSAFFATLECSSKMAGKPWRGIGSGRTCNIWSFSSTISLEGES